MAVSILDFLNGLFSLVFVLISILVGILIALRYPKKKDRTFLLVGITWILMTAPWYPSTISFIVFIFTGMHISMYPIMIVGNIILPFALITWIIAFTELIYPRREKIFTLISSLFVISYLILFFIFLVKRPSLIGEELGMADVKTGPLVIVFQVILLLIVIITGTIFARVSLKVESKEVRLKGKFLLIAFYSFTIGALLDVFSSISILLLIIARIILISSALEFYCGFIMPPWVKRIS
jgi:hypothetical protein